MKKQTRQLLLEAWQYCDDNDKSTGFMIQYMQDFAGVDYDCVMKFIQNTTIEERLKHCNSQ